ncbi:MAG: hypothetical protein EKK46_16855 [Rhodocyclaceae bacterium]|nr:MAG: hypothetical protein EKK46_16855 [Rhodocyclaceae bacterium]
MLTAIDEQTSKDDLQAAMKAVDMRLVTIGGIGYAGMGYKIRVLKQAGYEDKGRPNPAGKLAAYKTVVSVLNELGDGATQESVLAGVEQRSKPS